MTAVFKTATAVVTALAGAGALFFGAATFYPTLAHASGCTSASSSIAGSDDDPNGGAGYGVSAWIVTRAAQFCDPTGKTEPGAYNEFITMLNSNAKPWAVSGMIRYPGATDWHGYAGNTSAGNCGGFCTVDDYSNTTTKGDNEQYLIIYSTASSALEMWAAGTREKRTSYDPLASGPNHWPGPWSKLWEAGDLYGLDYIAGTSSSRQNWTSMAWAQNKWGGSGSFGFSNVGDLATTDIFADYDSSNGGNPSYSSLVGTSGSSSAIDTYSSY